MCSPPCATRLALTPDAKITLEANPGDLCLRPADGGENMILPLAVLYAAGFNRLSFACSRRQDAELALLGRRHQV